MMQIDFSDGFLSPGARELRAVVHASHPKSSRLAYRVNRLAVDVQHELQVGPIHEILAAAYYARTLASTQAALILIEHGLPSQAKTVLRSALESLFPLCAIAKDPVKADELLESHEADRRTLADRMLRWQNEELQSFIPLPHDELSAIASNRAKGSNLYEIAKFAGMEDWYNTLYTLLSFAAHVKIADLDSHSVADESGQMTGLQNEPVTFGQTRVWLWAIEFQLRAIRAIADVLRNDAWGSSAESEWHALKGLVGRDGFSEA